MYDLLLMLSSLRVAVSLLTMAPKYRTHHQLDYTPAGLEFQWSMVYLTMLKPQGLSTRSAWYNSRAAAEAVNSVVSILELKLRHNPSLARHAACKHRGWGTLCFNNLTTMKFLGLGGFHF